MSNRVSRRRFLGALGGSAAAVAASQVLTGVAYARLPGNYTEPTPRAENGDHALPPLGYPYNALEPIIDEETMRFHHSAHHADYVTNLNRLLQPYPELKARGIVELLANLEDVPDNIRMRVRDNGGGHLNHAIFWATMAPGGRGDPRGALADAINAKYGNAATLRQHMLDAGATRFGSGWSWLTINPDGDLQVINRLNQDSPVTDGFVPLVGVDVWEHAYYLRYRNRRVDYLRAWFGTVNWEVVGKRYDAARA